MFASAKHHFRRRGDGFDTDFHHPAVEWIQTLGGASSRAAVQGAAIILNVTIGDRAVIGAGAVVTKGSSSTGGRNPARVKPMNLRRRARSQPR
jgi:UDP-3-O-[3-hydroxymyristoyl] glucosamine N-acyltransferase